MVRALPTGNGQSDSALFSDRCGRGGTRGSGSAGKGGRIAFPEVIGDFIKRELFPFLGLRQPKYLMLAVKQGALPANHLLAADFNELVHELHSCGVKPIYPQSLTDSDGNSFHNLAHKRDSFIVLR